MAGYSLGRDALLQIQQLVRDTVRRERQIEHQATDAIQPIYIAKTGGSGIPALSTDTPGTGDVTVYEVNDDGDLEAATDSDGDEVTVEAYNLSSSAVAADSYVQLTQEIASGKLVVEQGLGRKKSYCRFTLDEALTTTDGTASATIDSQWGQGQDHASTSITVNNCDESGGDYIFEGDNGDYGLATYSGSGTTWNIIQMECP